MTNKWAFCVARCALVLVVGLSLAGAAAGQTGWGYGGAYYPSYGFAYLPPIPLRADQPIPYYAVHPPVYYSHVVPRPYGYSPYAYVPGVVTPEFALRGRWREPGPLRGQDFRPKRLGPPPEAEREDATRPNRQAAFPVPAPAPAVIENPYVDADLATAAERRGASRAPLRIANPYCEREDSARSGLSEAPGDNRPGAPRIVFPVAVAGAGR